MSSSSKNNIINQFTQTVKMLYWGIETLYTLKKETRWGNHYVQALEKKFECKLKKSIVDRIVNGYRATLILAATPFTQLRNRKTNTGEKERMLLYFLCGVLYDDFTDKKELSEEELYRISFNPEEYLPSSKEEKIFLYAHLLLKKYVKNKEYYQKVSKEIYEAQIESQKQANPFISDEDIKRITINKGGPSVLLCHFYLDEDTLEDELNCWYQLGVIAQFTDDLMDIFENIQEGINTLPTRMKDPQDFNTFYMNLVTLLQKNVLELPFPKKSKECFIYTIFTIASMSHLVLQQLMKIKGSANQLPDLKKLPREALILDMTKPINLFLVMKLMCKEPVSWKM